LVDGKGTLTISKEDLGRLKIEAIFNASTTCPARLVSIDSLPLTKVD